MDLLPLRVEIDLDALTVPTSALSTVEALVRQLGKALFVDGGEKNVHANGRPVFFGAGQWMAEALAKTATDLWIKAQRAPTFPWSSGTSGRAPVSLFLRIRLDELRDPHLAEVHVGNVVYELAQALFEIGGEYNVRGDGTSVLRGHGHHAAQELAERASQLWRDSIGPFGSVGPIATELGLEGFRLPVSWPVVAPDVAPRLSVGLPAMPSAPDGACELSTSYCTSGLFGGVRDLCEASPLAPCAPSASVCAEVWREEVPPVPVEAQRHSARVLASQALQRILLAYDKAILSGLSCSVPLAALSTMIHGGQENDSEDCFLRLQMILSLYDLGASKGLSYAVREDGLALREAINHARQVLSLACSE